MWQRNEERRRHLQHSLRNMSYFFPPPSRLVYTDNFPLVLFPQLWNNFDDVSIKSIVSKTEFNSKLKCHLLKDLQYLKASSVAVAIFTYRRVAVFFSFVLTWFFTVWVHMCLLSDFHIQHILLQFCLWGLCSTIWRPDRPLARRCRLPARLSSLPPCGSVPSLPPAPTTLQSCAQSQSLNRTPGFPPENSAS